jgi:hypothetical protein
MTQLDLVSALSSPRLEMVYVLVAVVCLLSALHFLRVALAPVAALVRAVTAAFLVALTISAALALLTIAAFIS